jgi:hypothetical protein
MYIRAGDISVPGSMLYTLGDAGPSSREVDQRFKRVTALVTEGIKTAKDAIPQLKIPAQQELLRFMTSLLETNFFPRGHGLIDDQGKVLRQSKLGMVAVPIISGDGTRWPSFEYRVRLYLSDQIVDPNLRGRHMAGHFSGIRLFTRTLHGATSTRTVLTALHELTHMALAMIRSLEQLRGKDTAAKLLTRDPWRLLDLSGFTVHRERLERHMRDLLRVLPIPIQAVELAAPLVEEAFAFMFGVLVDEAIARSSHAKAKKRGPAVLPTVNFSPEEFITTYVVERGFNVTREQLKARGAQQIFLRMTSDVDALAVALRMHLGS